MQTSMQDLDSQNPALATAAAQVDALNAGFHGTLRSPGPPLCSERPGDARRVYEALDTRAPLRARLERRGIPTGDLRAVSRLRVSRASSAFSFRWTS